MYGGDNPSDWGEWDDTTINDAAVDVYVCEVYGAPEPMQVDDNTLASLLPVGIEAVDGHLKKQFRFIARRFPGFTENHRPVQRRQRGIPVFAGIGQHAKPLTASSFDHRTTQQRVDEPTGLRLTDHIFVGEWTGDIEPSPLEVAERQWTPLAEVRTRALAGDAAHAPWVHAAFTAYPDLSPDSG